MEIKRVEVTVTGTFGAEGEPGTGIKYAVQVHSDHPENEITDLIASVDQIAEIHNTLRSGTSVTLEQKIK